MSNRELKNNLFIALGAALLFIPFLGQVHLFDWDEINFAESAREMILTGDYLTVRIFFEPFWEKPPLFIWLQVLSMKIFGINEFAARFPNAICGIVTLLVLYNLGRKYRNSGFGLLWVMAYGCSILPFLYFKSGIIDPWFNLFIFLGIWFYFTALRAEEKGGELFRIVLSALFIGLAVLTKGPVSILVFGLVALIFLIINRFRLELRWWSIPAFIVVLALSGGFWFLLQIFSGNAQVVVDFIVYQIRLFQTQDAGHGGFPLYHFVILLFGMFPASVFAIQGHRYLRDKNNTGRMIHTGMIILLWVVLLLFSLVKTKIVHYSSLTYFPVSFLAAYSIHQIFEGKFTFRKWQGILLAVIGAVLGLLIIMLPVFMANKHYFIDRGLITHSFTVGNLQADPGWNILHSLIGVVLVIATALAVWSFRNRNRQRIITLFSGSALFILLTISFVTPGAEKISQRAVIDFIKEKQGKDVYVHSFYKSYATLFYFQQPVPADERVFNRNWLTKGDIDKDVYFVFRIDKKEEVLTSYPEVEVIGEENGYVFGKRIAEKP